MMTFKSIGMTMALAGCIAVSGCQSVGNGRALTSRKQADPLLVVGQTTKADVTHNFGEAQVQQLHDGYEVWTYQQTNGIPKFLNYLPIVGLVTPSFHDRTTELALLFGPDGVLRNVDHRGRTAR